MKAINTKIAGAGLVIVLGILLVLSVVGNVNLATRLKQLEAENSQITEQINQLTLTMEENDKKIEAAKRIDDNMVADLIAERTKVIRLEEELKKCRGR